MFNIDLDEIKANILIFLLIMLLIFLIIYFVQLIFLILLSFVTTIFNEYYIEEGIDNIL